MRQSDQKFKDFILESQKQAAKYDCGGQLKTQHRDWLIVATSIHHFRKEFIQKFKSSFQGIKTTFINYEAVYELDFQLVKVSNTLLSRRDGQHSQGL